MFSSPAATAVISLAFGRYILEPFFIQCEIPELAIKLITAVGISEYVRYKYRVGGGEPTKVIGYKASSDFFAWWDCFPTSCSFCLQFLVAFVLENIKDLERSLIFRYMPVFHWFSSFPSTAMMANLLK